MSARSPLKSAGSPGGPGSTGTGTKTLFARKCNASVRAASIGLTLLVTGLAFLLVRSQENRAWEAGFQLDGKERVRAFDHEMQMNLELLQSLVAFYASSEQVERHEFIRFLALPATRREMVQSFQWAPRVPHSERRGFEDRVRAEVSDFAMKERDLRGNLVRAGEQAEYFPVTYVTPWENDEQEIGFDLLSHPDCRAALEAARDSGQMRATGPVSLRPGSDGLLVLAPLYRMNDSAARWEGVPPATMEQRRASVAGFCMGVYRISAILERAMRSPHGTGVSIALFDGSAAPSQRLLARYSTDGEFMERTAESLAQPKGLHHRESFELAGRRWTILCTPSPAYHTQVEHWKSWSALVTGSALTAFLALSFLQHRRYSETLERRVAHRTQELGRAFQQLQTEGQVVIRTQQALREKQEELQAILNNTTSVVYVKDCDGRYLLVNQRYRWLFELSDAEIIGKTDRDLFPEQVADTLRANDLKVLAGLEALEIEEMVPGKGQPRTYISVKFPLRNEHGAAYAVCGISTDITERKRAEEDLRRANRSLGERERQLTKALADLKRAHEALKSTQLQLIQSEKLESIGKLAAGVAHEVKNPLQTMIMGLTFLQKRIHRPDENVKTTFTDMQEAIERADSIIRGLLQMSGNPDLAMSCEDVNALIEKALWLVNYSLNANRIDAVRHLDPDLPKVWLDPGKIEQVILNLCTNAIHAMPNGGTLFVTTYARRAWSLPVPAAQDDSPSQVFIEIQDTGAGIAAENLSKLFTPFFTTKKRGLGTGLGLSVTKSIIELHGGQIELSNAPEGGAKATVMLPTEQKGIYEKSTNTVCR